MDIQGKLKKVYPPETLTFQDGRTYTQQLVILDCGEYSRAGDFYENDIAFHFGERHIGKVTQQMVGAKVQISFGMKGRTYTYQDKADPTKQREGHSIKLNAYDIQVLEQSPLVQAAAQSVANQPYQAPPAQPAQQYPPQAQPQQYGQPTAQAYQQPAPQAQPQAQNDLPF